MRQGIRIQRRRRFTHIGRRYPIGTAFIRNSENPADLNARLAALIVKHGAEMVPIDSTWVDDGTSLGSNEVAPFKTPKVLLVWDTPTQSLSAGWTRYTLERRFGVAHRGAHQLARPRQLQRLRRGDAVGQLRGDDQRGRLNRIKDWLRSGGTLITVAEASRWATGSSVGLLDVTTLLKDGRPDVPPPSGSGSSSSNSSTSSTGSKPSEAFDYDKAIQPDRERPASQPGAILRVNLDTNHWLTAGNDAETQVMIEATACLRRSS